MDSLHGMLCQLPEELDIGTRLSIEDGVAVITFPSERAQKIRLVTRDDHYVFTSRILGRRRVKLISWSGLARLPDARPPLSGPGHQDTAAVIEHAGRGTVTMHVH